MKSINISCGARLAPFDIQELREITLYDELESLQPLTSWLFWTAASVSCSFVMCVRSYRINTTSPNTPTINIFRMRALKISLILKSFFLQSWFRKQMKPMRYSTQATSESQVRRRQKRRLFIAKAINGNFSNKTDKCIIGFLEAILMFFASLEMVGEKSIDK